MQAVGGYKLFSSVDYGSMHRCFVFLLPDFFPLEVNVLVSTIPVPQFPYL